MRVRQFLTTKRWVQVQFAASLLSRGAPKRLVDVGCGDGVLECATPAGDILAIDVVVPSRFPRSRRDGKTWVVVGDMRTLPLADGTADAVALIAVLGATAPGEDAVVLAQARRVLRPGGRVVVLVSRMSLYSFVAPERLQTGWKWRHFCVSELAAQMARQGFDVTQIHLKGGPVSLLIDLVLYAFHRLSRRCAVTSAVVRVLTVAYNIAEAAEFAWGPRMLARYAFVEGNARSLESSRG